jgi:outer membrane protein assembly factor BamB
LPYIGPVYISARKRKKALCQGFWHNAFLFITLGDEMKMRLAYIFQTMMALTAAAILVVSANAEDWPQWRGPFFNGFTSEEGLPDTWNKAQNLLWVVKMPGPGAATPIIWEDRVFMTAIETESKKMWAICLARSDGRELWKHEIGVGFFTSTGNNGVSPSPIADGERVYFLFGTGDLLAFDMDGQIIWKRNIEEDHGKIQIMYRYGASPLLYQGKLYIAVMHRHTRVKAQPGQPKPMSYLLCIDPRTGEDLWKYERKTDAKSESMEAYTTPYPFEGANGSLIIVAGANYVTAHDPDNGREVWRSFNINPAKRGNYRLVSSVVSAGGMVIFYEPRGEAIFAVKGDSSGQMTENDIVWTTRENAPDVCTPLVMDGKLFVLDGNRRVMSCLDPGTGEVLWRGKLGANKAFQASPTGADGKIYCISMGGEVVVLSAGDTFEVLSRIDMGEGECRSTISVAHRRIFIRTSENLYCIGTGKETE